MELFPFFPFYNKCCMTIHRKTFLFRFLDRKCLKKKNLVMASSCTYYLTKYGSTGLCDQSCGVQPGDRQTAHVTWTDKSLKTKGPKILSNYIFYFKFKTVIIGGPILVYQHVIQYTHQGLSGCINTNILYIMCLC